MRSHGAAQAEPGDIDLVRAGDVADDVEGCVGPLDQVVLQRDVPHRGPGIAVGDREHGALVLDRPLQETAPRGQVHDVVLVDPGRARQQRGRAHLPRLRRVLDEFHELVAENYLSRRGREVAAQLERLGVTWRGRPRLCARSAAKFRAPRTTLAPAVSKACFTAAGLVTSKFVGANASNGRPAASCAFASAAGSPRRRPAGPPRSGARPGTTGAGRRTPGWPPRPGRRTGGPSGPREAAARRPGPAQRDNAAGPIRARLVPKPEGRGGHGAGPGTRPGTARRPTEPAKPAGFNPAPPEAGVLRGRAHRAPAPRPAAGRLLCGHRRSTSSMIDGHMSRPPLTAHICPVM